MRGKEDKGQASFPSIGIFYNTQGSFSCYEVRTTEVQTDEEPLPTSHSEPGSSQEFIHSSHHCLLSTNSTMWKQFA
jgi:hypothetical protein